MEILSVQEMYVADQAAIANGVLGDALMEAAGEAVAHAILAQWSKRPVCVLAGPGNNGGDGFVVARLLKDAGWSVALYLMGEQNALTGDAATNAKRWRNRIYPLEDALDVIAGIESEDDLLVVDALFGAGLSRPLEGTAKLLVELLTVTQAQGTALPIVSIDIPSGLNGDTGRTFTGKGAGRRGGICVHADLTVTFCRPKPGHFLMPGRGVCGEIVIADIGIPEHVIDEISPQAVVNDEDVWGDMFPVLRADTHKFARGHVVVLGGEVMTGAGRLASAAARRVGAGLVSVAAPQKAFDIYAMSLAPGTLVEPFRGVKGFKDVLSDPRKTTFVIGPGAGVSKPMREMTLAAVQAGKACVLDADALSAFESNPKSLFKAAKAQAKACGGNESVVLTPHGGEFPRLFPDLAKKYQHAKASKFDVVRQAAKRSGCVVLFKGPDTVVACPDGRVAVTINAPQWLATAGAGDVLSGLIGGLMGQGMPAFEAANAAAWLHGEAANAFGPGLIAEDIIDQIPPLLAWLWDDEEEEEQTP